MENAFGQPQNVVVFGGSSDMARAVVARLVQARTRTVVLAGRSEELLAAAAHEATVGGATSTATVLFNAEDPSSAGRTVGAAFDRVGAPVDLVILAVGLLSDQLRDENDPVAAAKIATVNFTWPVAALAEVRRRLVAQGSGRILVFSSITAVRVRRGAYLYGGAKAGLDRLCMSLADSLDGTGVTLQVVRPGFVKSKMTEGMKPAPFAVGVNDVAESVMKGLASGQRVIYSPAVLQFVYAILRHLPAALWRKVSDR